MSKLPYGRQGALASDIDRTASITQTAVNLAPADTPLIGPSARRIGMLIQPPSWGRAWLSMDTPAGPGVGIAMDSDSDALFLKIAEVGDMVRRSWRVWHTGLDIGLRPWPAKSRTFGQANAVGAAATITVTPAANECVAVEGGSAVYSPNAIGGVNLTVGGATVQTVFVQNYLFMPAGRPFVSPPGQVVGISLSSGGAGVSGFLAATYSILPAPQLYVYEIFAP